MRQLCHESSPVKPVLAHWKKERIDLTSTLAQSWPREHPWVSISLPSAVSGQTSLISGTPSPSLSSSWARRRATSSSRVPTTSTSSETSSTQAIRFSALAGYGSQGLPNSSASFPIPSWSVSVWSVSVWSVSVWSTSRAHRYPNRVPKAHLHFLPPGRATRKCGLGPSVIATDEDQPLRTPKPHSKRPARLPHFARGFPPWEYDRHLHRRLALTHRCRRGIFRRAGRR